MRRLSRRGFLTVIGGIGTATLVGAGLPWLAGETTIGRVVHSRIPLPAPFQVPLPIPPVLTPRQGATTDYYEITQRVAIQEILPGVPTQIWGYDGMFPGPTIVSRSGRRTVIRHRNELPVPTVVHLHGGHTPAASDGYPTDLILPERLTAYTGNHAMGQKDDRAVITQGTRDYDYPLRQRAATLWYHDHRMDFTGGSVWRGLSGFHIVRDDEEDALPLPRAEREIPLMITDRSFAEDGSLAYPALDRTMMTVPGVESPYRQGVLGDVVLVNGAPWPILEVDAARYRFRLLNGSNARRYRLAADPPPPGGGALVQIGSDGGLLTRPLPHDTIDIGPAERFDVVVDFSRYPVGQQITMRNQLDNANAGLVMRFRVARRGQDDSHLPDRLSEIEPLPERRAAVTRDFTFRDEGDLGWTINGKPYSPQLSNATPRLGDIEIWRFNSDFDHPIHLHLVHFQVLSRNGEQPGPYDTGWKDTIDLHPAEQVAVIMRFTDYPGRYVYHCHNLEHEDMAMMANFEVR